MHAQVNDEIVVRGRHVGDQDRKGAIIEVNGEDGIQPTCQLISSADLAKYAAVSAACPPNCPAGS